MDNFPPSIYSKNIHNKYRSKIAEKMGSVPSKYNEIGNQPAVATIESKRLNATFISIFKFLLNCDKISDVSFTNLKHFHSIISCCWNINEDLQWKKRLIAFESSKKVIEDKLIQLFSRPQLLSSILSLKKKIQLTLLIYCSLTLFVQKNYIFTYHAGKKCIKMIKELKLDMKPIWMPTLSIVYYIIGRLYSNGKGCIMNDKKAFKFYKKCVVFSDIESGAISQVWNGMSLVRLSAVFQFGYGCMKRPHISWKIAELSALNKYPDYWKALTIMGCLLHSGNYTNGLSIEEAHVQAIALFKEALEIGNCKFAAYSLANCMEKGEGVEKNLIEAIQMYEYAERLGHTHSKNCLLRINRNIRMERCLGNI